MPVNTVQQFGHEIAVGLAKNKTSWLFYNLGILYWRIKGEAPQAIECGRRAVYYAPRYTTKCLRYLKLRSNPNAKIEYKVPKVLFNNKITTFRSKKY